jgi:hypothetical protein
MGRSSSHYAKIDSIRFSRRLSSSEGVPRALITWRSTSSALARSSG